MPQSGQNISPNMFYMWRCVIAVAHAHADGRVNDKERAYFKDVFSNMDRAYALTDEQKKTFADDIENPKNVWQLLPNINDSSVRAQLIYFCGMLAHAEGTVDPLEKAIINKLQTDQMSGTDMDSIHKQVNEAVNSEMFQHDLAMSQIRPQSHKFSLKAGLPLEAILDDFLLRRFGYDILENSAGDSRAAAK